MRGRIISTAMALALVCPGLLLGADSAGAASSETYEQLNLFGDVFERVRSDYVDKVDDSKLIQSAVDGMLRSLDPHSSYLDPKTFHDMQVQTRGEFGGLGIEVTMENGVVKVVSPIDDTPASRADLRAGDYITHIDGDPVLGLSLSDAVEKMRGPVGSSITLTINRPGRDKPFDVSLKRDVVKIKSVRYHAEGDDIAYIRITSFNEQTESGLNTAMQELGQQLGERFKGIVLDLRNNPGGLLDQAIAVSDTFLDKGEIVSTRGRKPEDTQRYSAKEGDLAEGKPIIVLINGGSASASEIVAGALQDHKRAIVLGTKSFGKGSVQTIIPIQGHGAIRLTTARYYTPSGRSIQAKGIDPDIEVHQARVETIDGQKLRSEADLPKHLQAEESQRQQEEGGKGAEQEDRKDFQLSYAVDLLRSVALLEERRAD